MKKVTDALEIKLARKGVQAFADAVGVLPSMIEVTKDARLRIKGDNETEKPPLRRSKER